MARIELPKQRSGIVGTGGVRRGYVTGLLSNNGYTRVFVRVPRLYEDAELEVSSVVLPRELKINDRVFVASIEGRWDELVIIGLEA